jgi:single-stranded DNA-binding protein
VLVSQRVKESERWIDGEPIGHAVTVYGRLAEAGVLQLRQGSRVIGHTETHA